MWGSNSLYLQWVEVWPDVMISSCSPSSAIQQSLLWFLLFIAYFRAMLSAGYVNRSWSTAPPDVTRNWVCFTPNLSSFPQIISWMRYLYIYIVAYQDSNHLEALQSSFFHKSQCFFWTGSFYNLCKKSMYNLANWMPAGHNFLATATQNICKPSDI